MTNDDQHLEGNVDTTPNEKRESEETSDDFESLFEDSEESQDEQKDDVTKKLERLEKGIKVLATRVGREKVEKADKTAHASGQEATKSESSDNEDATIVYFENKPEAELVNDDLESIAKAKYNGSKIKAWKNETWLQTKAKALAEAKEVEEKSKSKISKPSSGAGSKALDLSQVKPEDVSSLTPTQKVEWLKKRAQEERTNID